MPKNHWLLTDSHTGTYEESAEVLPEHVAGTPEGWSIRKHRLRGGLSDGVDLIEVDNGAFRFSIVPTRGMGIHRARLGEMEIGWKSPVAGPVHPAHVPLSEPSGLGWLSGFDEFLVRCGLESNGAPEFDDRGTLRYPLHGRIANRPAHRVEVSVDPEVGEMSIRGVVDETRFLFLNLRLTVTYRTRFGEQGVRIEDEIENRSASPAQAQVLYHVNFGPPLLGAGAEFLAPIREIAPRDGRAAEGLDTWQQYAAEEAGFAEQVYFMQLAGDRKNNSLAMLRSANSKAAACLRFNLDGLPCFSLWKNTAAAADGYVTGLEPGTNYPNPRTFEGGHGRVVDLVAGGKTSLSLQLEVAKEREQVQALADEIAQLQEGVDMKSHNVPIPKWGG